MKKHLSVLYLVARGSVYKLPLLFLLLAVIDAGLLYWTAVRTAAFDTVLSWDGSDIPLLGTGFESLISESFMWAAFVAAAVALSVLLARVGCDSGGRQAYTLGRLQISERAVWGWQTLYNALCFWLLVAVQALVLYGCASYWAMRTMPLTGNQSVFLAFYRSDFLHSVMPLAEGMQWVKHALYAAAFGAATALYPYRQRRGGKPGRELSAVVCFVTLTFRGETGWSVGDVAWCIGIACYLAVTVWRVMGKDGWYDEKLA